jgi:formate hydrogenlyase subunit 6/NADH:ubiquinone oxidoreductase subunit I
VSAERLTTVQYPEERIAPIEATRDFPFLVYDGSDWQAGMRCVACQICEKECPPKCIYIVKSTDKKPDALGKPQIYPARFDIDISVCMSCQICVEVCPFEAIKMDTEFELSTTDRFGGLLFDKEEAGQVERALSQDSSHGGGRSGRASGRREGQGGREGEGGRCRCCCQSCGNCKPAPSPPLRR